MVENGAAKFDTITYDHRKLPTRIVKGDGTEIVYRYNSEGQRIYKKVGAQSAEHYILDGDQTVAVYQNGSLKYWNILANGVVGRYEPGSGSKFYYLKDHLGSTRAVVDAAGNVKEALDYYPFGLLMPGRIYQGSSETKEKFVGKERDSETGWYHFTWRPYAAVFGRWFLTDPQSDQYPQNSPYAFVSNNPLFYIEIDGAEYYVDSLGTLIPDMAVQDEEDQTVYLVLPDGSLLELGELGGEINVDIIFENLLQLFTEMAEGMDPITFFNLVKPGGDWDLKANENTLFGLSSKFKSTVFYFQTVKMQAQDLGNMNFGATGKATGHFPEWFMHFMAGQVQILERTSRWEWQGRPFYGDDPRDWYWIEMGFDYYKALKKKKR